MTGVTELATNLFVSGVEAVREWSLANRYGVVISCCNELAQLHYEFSDDMDGMTHQEEATAKRAAELVEFHRATRPVLVFCREGSNRSCLVAALALVRSGMDRAVAYEFVVTKRSPALAAGQVLTNRYFRELILTGQVTR